mgnify:FL=1
MKKIILLISTMVLLQNNSVLAENTDFKFIKKVIIESYIHGLIDGEDYEKAREGIHKDFVILGHSDSLLTQKSRDEWIEQRKSRPNLKKVTYDIEYIDIEGEAANSKIKLIRGNIIAYDFIFLYKFNSDWKIVSAIDHVEKLNESVNKK